MFYNLDKLLVVRVQVLRTGHVAGPTHSWLISFRGLVIAIATEFILLSLQSICLTKVTWESSLWLGKKYCAEY